VAASFGVKFRDMTDYQKSAQGIRLEIKRRKQLLRARKLWYTSGGRHVYLSMKGFYLDGYRIMREIEQLKAILKSYQQLKYDLHN